MATILNHKEIASVVKAAEPSPTFLKDLFFRREKYHQTNKFEVQKYARNNTASAYLTNEDATATTTTQGQYETVTVDPGVIKEDHPIKNSALRQVLIGDHQFSNRSGDEVLAELVQDELNVKFAKQNNAEELQCAQAVLTGKVTVGSGKQDFKRGVTNTVALSSGALWGTKTLNIVAQLREWQKIVSRSGKSPNHLVMGEEAADAFLGLDYIKSKIDSFRTGSITDKIERLHDLGATYYGQFTELGIHLWLYNKQYVDGSTQKFFIDSKQVVLGADNAETHFGYGSIVADGRIHVGKNYYRLYQADEGDKPFKLFYASNPLAIPTQADAFLSATVL